MATCFDTIESSPCLPNNRSTSLPFTFYLLSPLLTLTGLHFPNPRFEIGSSTRKTQKSVVTQRNNSANTSGITWIITSSDSATNNNISRDNPTGKATTRPTNKTGQEEPLPNQTRTHRKGETSWIQPQTGNKNDNTHMCELTRTLNTTVHGVSVTTPM
jgi:hypothetical protein